MSVGSPLRPNRPASPPTSAFRRPIRRIGMVSTYPPKLCGLATFAAALEQGLVRTGNRVDVVRLDDGEAIDPKWITGPVVDTLINGDAASIRAAAARLSQCDVVIIQHEYGIFGGPDGDEVIDLIQAIDVPTIVVLHTVPRLPTDHQRLVLVKISELASRVVVMTKAALYRLTSSYPIDPKKVSTIPHGATLPTTTLRADVGALTAGRTNLLTWGLLGPGKGVEHVIDAMSLLGDAYPQLHYTVAGVTHPKVFAARGDEYRDSLIERATTTGVRESVTFDNDYRDLPRLTRFVASASAVVLPYDSTDQVTSGVLVDAIAAGRPVIATAFPHAVELLRSGAGIVVPHQNPKAMAQAIRSIVEEPERLASMTVEAHRLAPSLSWTAVADRYAVLTDELVAAGQSVAV